MFSICGRTLYIYVIHPPIQLKCHRQRSSHWTIHWDIWISLVFWLISYSLFGEFRRNPQRNVCDELEPTKPVGGGGSGGGVGASDDGANTILSVCMCVWCAVASLFSQPPFCHKHHKNQHLTKYTHNLQWTLEWLSIGKTLYRIWWYGDELLADFVSVVLGVLTTLLSRHFIYYTRTYIVKNR